MCLCVSVCVCGHAHVHVLSVQPFVLVANVRYYLLVMFYTAGDVIASRHVPPPPSGNKVLSALEHTLASVGAACHSHAEAR